MPSKTSFSFKGNSNSSAISLSFSIILTEAKRTGMPAFLAYGSSRCTTACIQPCTEPFASPALSLSGQKSILPGASLCLATCIAWSTSSSIPSFFTAEIGTTGIPKIFSSSLT